MAKYRYAVGIKSKGDNILVESYLTDFIDEGSINQSVKDRAAQSQFKSNAFIALVKKDGAAGAATEVTLNA